VCLNETNLIQFYYADRRDIYLCISGTGCARHNLWDSTFGSYCMEIDSVNELDVVSKVLLLQVINVVLLDYQRKVQFWLPPSSATPPTSSHDQSSKRICGAVGTAVTVPTKGKQVENPAGLVLEVRLSQPQSAENYFVSDRADMCIIRMAVAKTDSCAFSDKHQAKDIELTLNKTM
jgi:hypothetical protein